MVVGITSSTDDQQAASSDASETANVQQHQLTRSTIEPLESKDNDTATIKRPPLGAVTTEQSRSKGNWKDFQYDDNFTGEALAGLVLDSEWSTGTSLSFTRQRAQFALKCDREIGLTGTFVWPGSLLFANPFENGKLPVEYIIGGVRHKGWWPQHGSDAVRIASEDLQTVIDFSMSSHSMGIQFLDSHSEMARFNLAGIEWALSHMPCGVSPLMSTLSKAKQSLVRVEIHDAAGSGVVVDNYGERSLVLTAWHVIESFCDEVDDECVGVSVMAAGVRYHGDLYSFNMDEDVAVLDIDGILPVATLASAIPEIGTEVVTIGLPKGEHDFQYNEGRVVRHSGCSFESCLATNARAWSGFSGGALINLEGQIVGVISEGWRNSYYSNAVSVDAIRAMIE